MSQATMPRAQAPQSFPRGVLVAAGCVVGFTILVAGIGRLTGAGDPTPTTTPVVARDLRFYDLADGGVDVRDASDGRSIAVMAPGTNGFLRATLRGLASQRKRESIGDNIPFRLTYWADGRLTLADSSTGRLVDLESFGQTNEAVFAHFLPPPPASWRPGTSGAAK